MNIGIINRHKLRNSVIVWSLKYQTFEIMRNKIKSLISTFKCLPEERMILSDIDKKETDMLGSFLQIIMDQVKDVHRVY